MKAYKIFRWLLRASALTTVMFIMQACYGSPYLPDLPEEELTEESDTIVRQQYPEDLQSAEAVEEVQSVDGQAE